MRCGIGTAGVRDAGAADGGDWDVIASSCRRREGERDVGDDEERSVRGVQGGV